LWVALFGVGALAALLASSPKYGLRQGGIETKFQNRQRAVQWQGEQIDSTAAVDSTRLPQAPNQRGLLIPLWPVAVALGAVIIFAVAKLWLRELPQPTGDASNSQKP
jgi:hypothetical protein